MARIRTIKPEFFQHEGLYEAEDATGLPLRLAFIGLWCQCDKEGRFDWRPRRLKLNILPWDDVDFSRVLDALSTRGFVVKYTSEEEEFGFIPSWRRHQAINNRERESELPEPNENNIIETREQRVNDASTTREGSCRGEGKGREGEREGERNGKGKGSSSSLRDSEDVCAGVCDPAAAPPDKPNGKSLPKPSTLTWTAYAEAYAQRYGATPVRNAKVNGQLAQLVARIPQAEAPDVARWYVAHSGARYVAAGHPVGLLLQDAEALRTEWVTGHRRTTTAAHQADKRQATGDAAGRLIAKYEQEESSGQG
ncbi:MAG: hypothetical protein ACPGVG_15185 [Mycobacterium sp.]